MKKFWNWIKNSDDTRILRLEGPIDEESFWGDEITPQMFRDELESGEGDVTVWINSPGGNVFAAAEIYTMLRDYKGSITVKIDAIAASAASVVAMAGDTVQMSPVAMLMIHDPSTVAMGNTKDMEKAIEVLTEVKESIINAVSFDEIFKLYYALKAPYRKKAQFLCNEALVLQLMTIKDNNGNYIWKPGLEIGKPDTLLNRPLKTSAFMPEIKGGSKVMAFGDYSYYWVADRQNRTFRRLNELYARTDQVGFLTTQRVDGKLILPEAVQLLQMAPQG